MCRENLHPWRPLKYPGRLLKEDWQDVSFDTDYVTALLSCLMKPEHLSWLDRMWEILDMVTDEVLKQDRP
jgi:hypothetical protein